MNHYHKWSLEGGLAAANLTQVTKVLSTISKYTQEPGKTTANLVKHLVFLWHFGEVQRRPVILRNLRCKYKSAVKILLSGFVPAGWDLRVGGQNFKVDVLLLKC